MATRDNTCSGPSQPMTVCAELKIISIIRTWRWRSSRLVWSIEIASIQIGRLVELSSSFLILK